VHADVRPRGAHARQLLRAPDERALVRPPQRRRLRDRARGPRAVALRAADGGVRAAAGFAGGRAADALRERARRRRGRDRERAAEPLGQPVVRGQRRGRLAGARQQLDQAPARLCSAPAPRSPRPPSSR
jgi:hypothetical protein